MLAKDFGGEGRGTDRCRDRRMKKDFRWMGGGTSICRWLEVGRTTKADWAWLTPIGRLVLFSLRSNNVECCLINGSLFLMITVVYLQCKYIATK